MSTTENIQLKALFDYVNDIKPFHTKILNVTSVYQFADRITARILEKSFNIHATLSNDWSYTYMGNGVNTLFRIAPCVLPRTSSRLRKYIKRGKIDESIKGNGIYQLPYNNGIKSITVNGVPKTKGIDYVEYDIKRTAIQFIPGLEPQLNDVVNFELYSIDRLSIAFNDVWQDYEIQGYNYHTEEIFPEINDYEDGAFDVEPYDEDEFDENNTGTIENYWIELNPLGRILSINGVYYFEFYTPPDGDVKIDFRIFQQESSDNTAKTYMSDVVKFADSIRFSDNVYVKMREPISDAYDQWPFELIGLDEHNTLLEVTEAPTESAGVSITDSLEIVVTHLP
jgi:hypothetical protein